MKKILIAVPFLILVAAAGIYYFLLMSDRQTMPQQQEQQAEEQGLNVESGKLTDLLLLQDDSVCNFSSEDKSVSGTIYISENNFAAEMVMAEDEQVTNVVYTDDYMYLWSNEETVGTKILAEDRVDIVEEYDLNEQFGSIDKQVDYTCDNWTFDPAMFIVPQSVEFVDINRALEQVGTGSGGLKQIQCAACDEYEDFQQIATCKETLQCDN